MTEHTDDDVNPRLLVNNKTEVLTETQTKQIDIRIKDFNRDGQITFDEKDFSIEEVIETLEISFDMPFSNSETLTRKDGSTLTSKDVEGWDYDRFLQELAEKDKKAFLKRYEAEQIMAEKDALSEFEAKNYPNLTLTVDGEEIAAKRIAFPFKFKSQNTPYYRIGTLKLTAKAKKERDNFDQRMASVVGMFSYGRFIDQEKAGNSLPSVTTEPVYFLINPLDTGGHDGDNGGGSCSVLGLSSLLLLVPGLFLLRRRS